jgi:hypothetical protein
MQKERCRNGTYPSILGDIRNDHSNSMFLNHRAVNASLKPVAIGTDSRTPLNYQFLKITRNLRLRFDPRHMGKHIWILRLLKSSEIGSRDTQVEDGIYLQLTSPIICIQVNLKRNS